MMTKKVFILGTDYWALKEMDWDQDAEYWALNNMHNMLTFNQMEKVTGWFDLHPDERRERRWEVTQIQWLMEEHPFPIYVQASALTKDKPSAVEFPIDKIGKKLMGDNWLRWKWEDNYKDYTKLIVTESKQRWFGCTHAFMTLFCRELDRISYCLPE